MLDFLKTITVLSVFIVAAAVLAGAFWGIAWSVARWVVG
jgi:hypothetical protein